MLKGLLFFAKICWKSSKKYIIYLFLNEIISAVQPLYNIILPKYIIDELTGQQDIQKIILYIAAIVLGNWMFSMLQGYFSNESFRLRVSVAFAFTEELSQKLGMADYEKIENPDYLDLKQKAEHFIYGDMHGFGYVLDSAVSIISKIVSNQGNRDFQSSHNQPCRAFGKALR